MPLETLLRVCFLQNFYALRDPIAVATLHDGEARPDYVTDNLRFHGAALKDLGVEGRQETGRWLDNRAENSHLPLRRRERAAC